MNRTIKFRVWNKAKNTWEYGPHEMPSLDGVNLFGETILLGSFLSHLLFKELDDVVALQYTGLKDKNGREIFEGDIVSFQYYIGEDAPQTTIGEVYFSEGMFLFGRGMGFAMNDINFRDETLAVLGNIFENPELIKCKN